MSYVITDWLYILCSTNHTEYAISWSANKVNWVKSK